MIKLNAGELRTYGKDPTSSRYASGLRGASKIKKNPIYIVLDNVLDTYNIGSIFRLADAVSAEEVIICGQSEIPPNTRIKKASINTTEWVKWRYVPTAVEAITKLRIANCKLKIVCVEQDAKSIPYTKMEWEFPVAVVIGNETTGVSKEVLDICDSIVELPMFGVNISLNVMVSLGIVLYEIVKSIRIKE